MTGGLGRFALVAMLAIGLVAAGCGGDDEEEQAQTATEEQPATESPALYDEIADLPDEQQVERVGAAWAKPFAEGDEAMCAYLHPDIAPNCSGFVQSQLTGSTEIQQSYGGAKVESVEVKGRTAVAKFSNGEQVTFEKDANDEWKVTKTSRAPGG